jgi:hypothetical protein
VRSGYVMLGQDVRLGHVKSGYIMLGHFISVYVRL